MTERPAAYAARRSQLKDGSQSEKSFSQQVYDFAKLHGWKVQRHWSEKFSPAGWPDLTFCRPIEWYSSKRWNINPECQRLIFAELKSSRGKLTREQEKWRDALRAAKVPCYVWRPSDWPEIERVLGDDE